ncbi:MAG: RecX family transcriptional regulator, partial [Phycisphaerales bacterium]|nr:RecX family transcriptional regulator [Phycisphaerales bacterium]
MSSDDRQRGREPEGTLFPAAAGAGLISVVRELAGTPKRVSVLVGRRRAAVLLSTQAMEMGLAPGVAWTEEVAARAARLERVNAAKAMAMRRLAARARSRAEMAAWLESKGVDEGIAAEAVERLVEVGLIRDEDVAADEIRRAEAKGLSGRAIAERLRERGVERGEAAEQGDAERALGVAKTVGGDELSRRGRETADVNVLARRVMGVLARK